MDSERLATVLSMLTSDRKQMDSAIDVLVAKSNEWAGLSISRRIDYLNRIGQLATDHAAEWVEAAVKGKQIRQGASGEGEEWASGPLPLLTWLHACAETLRAIGSGDNPLENIKLSTGMNGQVIARVYPHNANEALLLSGYRVDVWMQSGVTAENVKDTVAVTYRNPPPEGKVGLVLGAGNISSIPPLDLLYKLYADLEVVIVKLNPVNDYLSPVFEKIFEPLISDGYLRFVYGDGEVGSYLSDHPLVDTIHITGSSRTHDRIVFGGGEEGEQRRSESRPVLTKPITSELGGVSPTIVVPGPWTEADVAFQAEHIATQKLHNSGFNCVASQVLVLPDGWTKSMPLVDKLREVMNAVDDRVAYYPGAVERQASAISHAAQSEELGAGGGRTIITIDDVDNEHYCFSEEFFAPVLAVASLPAPSAAEFLRTAVNFANERLLGSLGANILIHPTTAKELGPQLEQAISELRYGAIGVNVWTGLAYLTQRAPWGAPPGHTLGDVQSGIGVVHNALLFDKAEKSVSWGPFHPFPRNLRFGQWHTSPKPFWFVTHSNSAETAKRATYFEADGKLGRLPGIFAAALRG